MQALAEKIPDKIASPDDEQYATKNVLITNDLLLQAARNADASSTEEFFSRLLQTEKWEKQRWEGGEYEQLEREEGEPGFVDPGEAREQNQESSASLAQQGSRDSGSSKNNDSQAVAAPESMVEWYIV
jgi:hypothetical protein